MIGKTGKHPTDAPHSLSMKELELSVSGMSCQGCVRGVEKAIRTVAPSSTATVKVGSARVTFSHDAADEEVKAILAAISDAGFDAVVK
ncbi:MAG: heavy-metal-associated domain-containing protein [Polyangiaceae bacterium]|nr:heavy-metal-associated domain-containing protein [Polyangiaceae bacterium]